MAAGMDSFPLGRLVIVATREDQRFYQCYYHSPMALDGETLVRAIVVVVPGLCHRGEGW